MKIGDKVQYYSNGILGAKGVIIREEKRAPYYSKFNPSGQFCFCYVVEYTLNNGTIVTNYALPENLKKLEN